MITTTVEATIERRLLVNYRIDPQVVARLLPGPFRPQLVSGFAVGGICFIRLRGIRPRGLPRALGLRTENVAHRFAVEWDDDSGPHVGVYVPRRDTSSRVSSWSGGCVFPGRYHLANFHVEEGFDAARIEVISRDREVLIEVDARQAENLESRLFDSLEDAVELFRRGAIGFSPSADGTCLDGVRLECEGWHVQPMALELARSSWFDDPVMFPPGTCVPDSALLMRDLPVRWVTEETGRPVEPEAIGEASTDRQT